MKARMAFAMAAAAFSCTIAFWFYGNARTLCETIGFNVRALIAGLLLGVVFPALVIITVLIAGRRIWASLKPIPLIRIILTIVTGLLTGSTLSEGWILVDESHFASEIRQGASGIPYSRPRAWPNEGCSLVHIPGRGVHATD